MPRSLSELFRGMLGEFAIVALIIFGLYCLAARADSTASHKQRSNTFGAAIYQDNTNSYLMGSVKSAAVARVGKDRTILVLEVSPTNTYQMFTQQLQLCVGIDENTAKKLTDAIEQRSVVVFTYSRVRHLLDCNDLYRVDKLAESAPLLQ